MKTILEFNLPEERLEANQALNVGKLVSAIDEYKQRLENIVKNNEDKDEAAKAQWALDLLSTYLKEEGIVEMFELY